MEALGGSWLDGAMTETTETTATAAWDVETQEVAR